MHLYSRGGQGVVAKEIRWRKGYGRRESKGREEETLIEWEVGGIGGKHAKQLIAFKIFRNRKRAKGRKANKKGWEPGMQVKRGGRFGSSVPPQPLHQPAQSL